MNDRPSSFWFPVKRYGWGWGLPVRWQGWLVLVGYLVLLYFGSPILGVQPGNPGLFIYWIALTVVLIAIIVAKGEGPVGWRWGKK